MEWPLISILIPAHNMAATLPTAIESVLRQDYPRLEIIVVDDASTDTTRELLWDYRLERRIRYVRNGDREGMLRTMNAGLRRAQGEFVTILAAEDRMMPGFLSRTAAVLLEHEHLAAVHTGVYIMDEGGRLLQPREEVLATAYYGGRDEFAHLLAGDWSVFFGSVLARRRLYDLEGYFSIAAEPCADYEMLVRWAASGAEFGFLPAPLIAYRVAASRLDGTYTSYADGALARGYFTVLKAALHPEHHLRLRGFEHRIIGHVRATYEQTLRAGYVDADGTLQAQRDELIAAFESIRRNGSGGEHAEISVIVAGGFVQSEIEKTLRSLVLQDTLPAEILVVHPRQIALHEFCRRHDPDGRIRLFAVDSVRDEAQLFNTGLRLASGSHFIFMRNGSTLPPRYLTRLERELIARDAPVLTARTLVLVNDTILHEGSETCYGEHPGREDLLTAPARSLESLTVSRTALDAAGSFFRSQAAFTDWELMLRLCERHEFREFEDGTVHLRAKLGTPSRYTYSAGLAPAAREIFERYPAASTEIAGRRAAYLGDLEALQHDGIPATWTAEGILQLHRTVSGRHTFENESRALRG